MKKNFSKRFPIWNVSYVVDDLRPQLGYIKFSNGFAYATDGRCAVRAKVDFIASLEETEIEKLEGKQIFAKSLKDLASYQEIEIFDDYIEAKGMGDPVRFYFWDSAHKGEFRLSIEKVFETALASQPKDKTSDLGVSPKLLNKVAKAIDADFFELNVDRGHDAILLRKHGCNEVLGIVMPISIDL